MSLRNYIVLERISKLVEVRLDRLTREVDLEEGLGLDDAGRLQLLVDLEDAFAVEFSDFDRAGVRTVGDVLDYCEKRLV